MKICTRCNDKKPFEAFYSSTILKSGYMSHCKDCESARCKAKNVINREQRLVKAKEWRDANKVKQEIGRAHV